MGPLSEGYVCREETEWDVSEFYGFKSHQSALPASQRQLACVSVQPSEKEGWCPFPTWLPCGCGRRSAAVGPSPSSCSL